MKKHSGIFLKEVEGICCLTLLCSVAKQIQPRKKSDTAHKVVLSLLFFLCSDIFHSCLWAICSSLVSESEL